jgi:hypothetical protein
LLVRPSPSARSEMPKGAPAVPLAEDTACHLRQAVENAQREGGREKLERAIHQRQQFWMDTCREVLEMRASSQQVLELHRHHGCRFAVPAARQVQHILDALDSALPGWDREHPGMFYRTLELNFPELLRFCRVQRRG